MEIVPDYFFSQCSFEEQFIQITKYKIWYRPTSLFKVNFCYIYKNYLHKTQLFCVFMLLFLTLKATSLQAKITLRPPTNVSMLPHRNSAPRSWCLMAKTEAFMCPYDTFPSPEPFLVAVHCWWPSLAQVGAQVTIIRKHIFMSLFFVFIRFTFHLCLIISTFSIIPSLWEFRVLVTLCWVYLNTWKLILCAKV